jgi:hypothetical protein
MSDRKTIPEFSPSAPTRHLRLPLALISGNGSARSEYCIASPAALRHLWLARHPKLL